ncbi:MAG TPA: hypothetical protein PL133_08685 [Methylophilaceae bacterium]|nr:hypothetical protein [Methylophilaceae bacterium]HQC29463.1 hypothetical protein [Methylotenera sp.]
MSINKVSLSIVVLAALMAGCAAQVTSSTPSTVVVRASVPDTGVEKALELAEAECAKRKLSARVRSVTSPNTDRYIFDCI